VSTLADALARRFLARTDAWVTQDANGRYRARRGQLQADALRDHLAGRTSLCAYALAPGAEAATALWGAFDLDAHGDDEGDGGLSAAAREELLRLARRLGGALAARVDPRSVVLETTGGLGLHVWVLLGAPTPARAVVSLLDEALTDLGLTPAARVVLDERLAVERYPKRAELAEGQVGTALRVPLGRHPRTGRRSRFLDPASGTPIAPGPVLRAGGAVLEIAPRTGPRETLPDAAPRAFTEARRHPAPDAWLTYRWLAERRGMAATDTPPPEDGRGHPVRCIFPDAHAHGDRAPGSAYLIRRDETQLYGCAVCRGGRAMDTIALIRRVYPALDFRGTLALCHEIDPARCPWSR
jgi:hypothetical protein